MGNRLAVRRVVAGVHAEGDALALGDGVVTQVRTLPKGKGRAIATIWQDARAPQVPIRSIDEALVKVEDQRLLPVRGLAL